MAICHAAAFVWLVVSWCASLAGVRESDGMIALCSHVLLPQALHARRPAAWAVGLRTQAFWVSRGQTLVGPERLNTDARCSFCAEAFDTMKQVQMQTKQLRAQLSKSPWPILKLFSSSGRSYSLPLRAESRELKRLPSEQSEPVLAYLAGFFDGDGCVTCESSLSGCCLQVVQSFDQAEVLMLFHETFGGSITRAGSVMGLRKPLLRWAARGQSARNAAQLLAPHSITKQQQLLLAVEWPEARSRREECAAELRALKDHDSDATGPCSWEYFAGFFDAEGYIHQHRGGASLVLRIDQKHPRVLKCLRAFLARSLGKDARLAKSRESMHRLCVCSLTACQAILQHLLAAGLLRKADQAKLVLGLTPDTAAQVHTELGHLTGNQMLGKRLDAAGLARARMISAIQQQAARLERRGHVEQAQAKLVEVCVLKQEHELLQAVHENQQLVEYMHKVQILHDNSWEGPFAPGM